MPKLLSHNMVKSRSAGPKKKKRKYKKLLRRHIITHYTLIIFLLSMLIVAVLSSISNLRVKLSVIAYNNSIVFARNDVMDKTNNLIDALNNQNSKEDLELENKRLEISIDNYELRLTKIKKPDYVTEAIVNSNNKNVEYFKEFNTLVGTIIEKAEMNQDLTAETEELDILKIKINTENKKTSEITHGIIEQF